MLPKRFTDPLGSRLPALERNILKLRAMQMMLVLFHAEELKRRIVDMVRATDGLSSRLKGTTEVPPLIAEGAKKPVEKALDALVADKAITSAERAEVVKLLDYRNVVGHELHNLLIDVSPDRSARSMMTFAPELLPSYDYEAADRLRHFQKRIGNLRGYVHVFSSNRLVFEAAEKTFLSEIARLRRKIRKQIESRRAAVDALNAELSLAGSAFAEEAMDPQHPRNRYPNQIEWKGRLTRRGVEICYRLFDAGKSTMAVAHLTDLSLPSALKRRKMWEAAGGRDRKQERLNHRV